MARFFMCVAAAACCCCCLALLLVPPVQGRLDPGLAGGGSFGGEGEGAGAVSVVGATTANLETAEQQRGGATTTAVKAKPARSSSPSWTPPAAVGGRVVRPELRSVPGGPDPLHHHGSSPWRPELLVPTTP